MRAVVVIPARYGSTRFPGKPLALIAGRPLIEHVYVRAMASRNVGRVVVATDDVRILDAVRGFGGEGMMTSAAHRSGSDRLGEVARTMDAEVIVNVQGDEPLIDPGVIDAVVGPHGDPDPPDIVTAAFSLDSVEQFRDRHTVKVITDRAGRALYFSRSPVPHGWEPGAGTALGHIGIYAYGREALLRFVSLPPGDLERLEDLEQLRALENGMRIQVVRVEGFQGLGVDRPEDVSRVERILRSMGAGDPGGLRQDSKKEGA